MYHEYKIISIHFVFHRLGGNIGVDFENWFGVRRFIHSHPRLKYSQFNKTSKLMTQLEFFLTVELKSSHVATTWFVFRFDS